MIFTIENETSNISIHATVQDADAVPNAERFRDEAQLGQIATGWPMTRMVEIWNSLPGETPVKKFKDRATAVSRIWKAIQSLGEAPIGVKSEPVVNELAPAPGLAETGLLSRDLSSEAVPPEAALETAEPAVDTPITPQTPHVAPETAGAKKAATRGKRARVAETSGESSAPREGSKTSQVIAMLKREGGTTLEEIMSAMKWQKHTTRAMLSAGGSLTRNHGLIVTSEKVGGKRIYSIRS